MDPAKGRKELYAEFPDVEFEEIRLLKKEKVLRRVDQEITILDINIKRKANYIGQILSRQYLLHKAIE